MHNGAIGGNILLFTLLLLKCSITVKTKTLPCTFQSPLLLTFLPRHRIPSGKKDTPSPVLCLHSTLTWLPSVPSCQPFPVIQRQPPSSKCLLALNRWVRGDPRTNHSLPGSVLSANNPCPAMQSKEPVWIPFPPVFLGYLLMTLFSEKFISLFLPSHLSEGYCQSLECVFKTESQSERTEI